MTTTIPDKKFTDFHSHILPGIDDGAKTLQDSIELIKTEISHGVTTIVLTPHFYPERQSLDEFLHNRQKSYHSLMAELEKQRIEIEPVLGAEVKFSPKLPDLDMKKLTIGGTDCILTEFSVTHYHSRTKDVFYRLQQQGFLPVIAHAERYENLPEKELYQLVCAGALVQVNAGSVLKNRAMTKKVERLIKANLVHLWGTDTHSTDKRPPCFDRCRAYLDKKFGSDYLSECMEYARDILDNREPVVWEPIKIKKKLFPIPLR